MEEGGGPRRRVPGVELRLVQSQAGEEEEEEELGSSITALVLRQPMKHKRAWLYLILTGLLIFTTGTLLLYLRWRTCAL